MDKRKKQLGMNPSTASNRLVKDLLWGFIVKADMDSCYRCGEKLSRENFSIEHKEAWLDSEDPVKLFFEIDNIAYSHLSCNTAARRIERLPCGNNATYKRCCRCADCKAAHAESKRKQYTPEYRRERYLKNEK